MINIFIPIDFSSESIRRIECSIDLFGIENCQYSIINTYDRPSKSSDVLVSIEDLLKKRSNEKLKSVRELISKAHPGFKDKTSLLSANCDLSDLLKKITKSSQINLVIIGTNDQLNEYRELTHFDFDSLKMDSGNLAYLILSDPYLSKVYNTDD